MREIIVSGIFTLAVLIPSIAQTSKLSPEQQWAKLEVLVKEAGGTVGFSARNAQGKTLQAWNDKQNFIPASSLKLLTALAVDKLAGDTFHFQTNLCHTGHVENGILYGDILIVGGGDPSLLSRYFPDRNPVAEWINAVKLFGIKEINGRIIGVDAHFKGYPLAFGVSLEDAGNYYGCGAWGLNAFDNTILLFLSSGEPGTTFGIIKSSDLSGASYRAQGTAGVQSTDEAFVLGAPWQFDRMVEGSIPSNRNSFQIEASMPDPALYLARYVTDQLVLSGVSISQEAASTRDLPAEVTILSRAALSPHMRELCEVMLRESHNLFADALFKQLSVIRGLDGRYATASLAFKEICELPERSQILDGSGLSRKNLICPYDFTQSLFRLSEGGEFVPPPGLYEEVLANGAVLYLKTGTMDNVRALSGYASIEGEGWFSFALMANGFGGSGKDIRRQMFSFIRDYFGSL